MRVASGGDVNVNKGPGDDLPDYYACVAEDVIRLCKPREGDWLDIGCGPGPVSIALAKWSAASRFILVDPDAGALARARDTVRELGEQDRFRFIEGKAESIPLPSESVDLAVSRGSVFFWECQVTGIREVSRVLRPGGVAMIGGGLGTAYPLWARKEFIRRRRKSTRSGGKTAMDAFRTVRSPDTFRDWAARAGIRDFEVIGEGGLAEDDPGTGVGIWLLFRKVQET